MRQLLRSTGTRNHGRRLTHVVTKQCHPRLRPSVVYHSRCIEHDARPISFTKGLGLWTPQQRSFQSKSTKATSFACMTCGQEYRKWQGKCNACDAWDQIQSIEKISMDPGQAKKSTGHTRKQWIAAQHSGNTSIASTFAIPMHQIEVATAVTERIQLPENELNWVFGGGIVPGSLTLLTGNPGIGKSTLALQLALMLTQDNTRNVVYISGEENQAQVKMRALRLAQETHASTTASSLHLSSTTNLDEILHDLASGTFKAVIVDSIQTLYAPELNAPPGTVTQVRECTVGLLQMAKTTTIPIVVIGHVTKSGDIAGPKVLEHIVDTVLHLEGDVDRPERFLRCVKNRFGSTHELGLFRMTIAGMFVGGALDKTPPVKVSPSRRNAPGVAMTMTVQGRRPLPIEIQALVDPSGIGNTLSVRGIAQDKVQLIRAIVRRHSGIAQTSASIFLNIAGGYSITDPSVDLALALAIVSSILHTPIPSHFVFLGELALTGELRPSSTSTSSWSNHLAASSQYGFQTCLVPASTTRPLGSHKSSEIQIIPVKTLAQAISVVFG